MSRVKVPVLSRDIAADYFFLWWMNKMQGVVPSISINCRHVV
jgi:hypothetical protein